MVSSVYVVTADFYYCAGGGREALWKLRNYFLNWRKNGGK
jgi:hypothetical protein